MGTANYSPTETNRTRTPTDYRRQSHQRLSNAELKAVIEQTIAHRDRMAARGDDDLAEVDGLFLEMLDAEAESRRMSGRGADE